MTKHATGNIEIGSSLRHIVTRAEGKAVRGERMRMEG
jgi:hypothetical protein